MLHALDNGNGTVTITCTSCPGFPSNTVAARDVARTKRMHLIDAHGATPVVTIDR